MVLAAPNMTGLSGRRWQLRGRFPDDSLHDMPAQPLVRHLLWHRGLRDAREAAAFLEARDPGHDLRLLPDAGPAVARLRRAIDAGELITVYGDFDVDGVTASAILIEAIGELGGKVTPYIPDRFGEGYGVNSRAIESLAADGVALIVTADCGTSSVEEIALARSLGADTIIVDHHTVPPELPPAVAIVNPKRRDATYPENELSSGGLALRVMQLLYESEGRELDAGRYLDLAALSTVCDMAPLRGENRWLVREGLRSLARAQRPGLRALFEASSCDPAHVTADTIGYVLGPRLNAAGRLAHARLSLDLLLERSEERARELAIRLCDLNAQRQAATAAAMELAKGLIAALPAGQPLIFIGHEDFPAGIVGLVAGRLMEDRHRPAVVYERGETTSRASCRSIPEFDITGALRVAQAERPLMVRFGGHRAAAGFTADNGNLDALRDSLLRQAGEALAGVDLTPVIEVDAAIPLRRVNGELVRALTSMAPFGVGNPEPVFLSRGLEIRDVKVMGDDGKHLRLQLRDGRVTWPAVAFGFGESEVECGHRLDVVYTFSADRGGDGALELRVLDFALSADAA
ncbi:MAG TPA: single-stranded-DNA-specific exonuclease RecJ [Dehalococcoidia bacterium]|jgi:single-stranded-DNA-specific exonuclease|nr:single-stranded-DNA-specific exonuclease RecJ [Dehalococcoidia bacterium]